MIKLSKDSVAHACKVGWSGVGYHAALARSHMNSLLPVERTRGQITGIEMNTWKTVKFNETPNVSAVLPSSVVKSEK